MPWPRRNFFSCDQGKKRDNPIDRERDIRTMKYKGYSSMEGLSKKHTNSSNTLVDNTRKKNSKYRLQKIDLNS